MSGAVCVPCSPSPPAGAPDAPDASDGLVFSLLPPYPARQGAGSPPERMERAPRRGVVPSFFHHGKTALEMEVRMLSLSLLTLAIGTADLSSHVDYWQGYRRAVREHKDLVIY